MNKFDIGLHLNKSQNFTQQYDQVLKLKSRPQGIIIDIKCKKLHFELFSAIFVLFHELVMRDMHIKNVSRIHGKLLKLSRKIINVKCKKS